MKGEGHVWQPRPQGFSLKKRVAPPIFLGKSTGDEVARLGIPIPKTLVIWAFPSPITLAIWVRVNVKVYTGNAHITRALGMGMPKKRGCPYHWDTASFPFPSFLPFYFDVRAFSIPADPTISEPGTG